MDFFAQKSVIPHKTGGTELVFSPGIGYHIQSNVSDVLAARLISQKTHLIGLYKPPTDKRTINYIEDIINEDRTIKKVKHSLFNVQSKHMYEIDQFLLSTMLKLDPRSFSSLLKTSGGHSRWKKAPLVQLSPFQLFIVFDSVLNMIYRSDLKEHVLLIFNQLRGVFGLTAMDKGKILNIIHVFSRMVLGISVRRRMGKTVVVHYDLATNLCLFPAAGLKALYTVHKAKAATECYSAVEKAVPVLVSLFNQEQYNSFQQRTEDRAGHIDASDFYYEAYRGRKESAFSLNVCYRQKNMKGNMYGGQCVSRNVLTCKAYTQRNVCIYFIFHTLDH